MYIAVIWLLMLGVGCSPTPYSRGHIAQMKNETRDLFLHGWSLYMKYGFPADEVRPDSCTPYGPDFDDIDDIGRNDAMANTSMTVLDNLDTLIIMDQWDQLLFVLDYLRSSKETLFEQNTIVQVFEQSIRLLGGIISAHLLIEMLQDSKKYQNIEVISSYDGFLLGLAHLLGKKLLPAYKTLTKIPVPRVNLAKGPKLVPERLQSDTCLAGAATPVLEFTLLSRLTGDFTFELHSDVAFWKLWYSRSPLDLLPMTIDPVKGKWVDTVSGIGALGDSFYEYSAKASIVFGDSEMWSVFVDSYKSFLTYSRPFNKMLFPNINSYTGEQASIWIDLLSAFWTGLQVLTGQLTDAVYTHLMYWKIWNTFDLIPEQWCFTDSKNKYSINLEWYPLRPEFIESTYYLYRATRDPMYLRIGERILHLLQTKFKAKCGFHGFQDIRTGEMQNRMETFVLSETLKYLYLLFDENDESFLHGELMKDKAWVFSTEAHPLWYPKRTAEQEKSTQDFLRSYRDLGDEHNFRHVSNKNRATKAKSVDYPWTGLTVEQVDPFKAKFYQCEVKPRMFNHSRPMYGSMYYEQMDLFSADDEYRRYLKRPEHLGDSQSFELEPGFLNRFSLGSKLQCNIARTSSVHDLGIGDATAAKSTEISYISMYGPQLQHGSHKYDIWLPEITNIRAQIEKFQVGAVDLNQRYISSEMIQELGANQTFALLKGASIPASPPKDSAQKQAVYRLLRINGVEIGDAKVWISPYKCSSWCTFSLPDKVLLEGIVMENVYAWW